MRPTTDRLRRGLLDLWPAIYRERLLLTGLRMLPLGTELDPAELPPPDASVGDWRPVGVGSRWGGADENAWFYAEAEAPDTWRARLGEQPEEQGERWAVALRLVLGLGTLDTFGWPEGLLYVNGHLLQGINRHHPDVLLSDADVRAGPLRFHVRAWSGMARFDHRIAEAEIALVSREAEALAHLLAMGVELVDALPESDPLLYVLHTALERAYNRVALNDVSGAGAAFDTSASAALTVLRAELADLRGRFDPAERPVVTAVGHGHLDVAWLWQTRHTREKAARTFGVATALMEHYPEYVFLHTTPRVFAWLKSDYPDLYARVKARVAEGRFEAAGAMWLESDCNLVSGEALVRQIMYGQRFLREEFGREYDALWLPDAFGYSAALPQIMLRSGIPVFMTTKLSWSATNRIPADTFRWRGLDGSDVLAHFITTPSDHPGPPMNVADTYNGAMDVFAVRGVWERYRDKGVNNEVLLAYGFGDGGAGPTRQHIERARALRALPGLPDLRLGRADAFFQRLRECVWSNPALPLWDGELYLEYHRGTYTSQAWLKRAHRCCEGLLLAAEALDAWQWALTPDHQAPDRRAALDDLWRTLLLHEFHDILPGSSIGAVYDDARAALAGLEYALDALITGALDSIAKQAAAPAGALVAYNPSPFARDAVVELRGDLAARDWFSAAGEPLRQQSAWMANGELARLVELRDLPARGLAMLVPGREGHLIDAQLHQAYVDGDESGNEPSRAQGNTLENAFFRLELNAAGEIASLVDKRVPGGRQLVAAGAALNRLDAFDDRPLRFDAWDIDATFEAKRYPVELVEMAVVEEDAPLRATLRVVRRVLSSTVEQCISLYHTIPRIDFDTRITWHEHHVLLKAAFPLDLRAREATSDVQYGAVARPAHHNTSWDRARFETVAHRWIDLSEGDYGVSLLNDGRYGHDVFESVVRLSLLRSPTSPDPHADQGEQRVLYSLFPHLGDWRAGGTVQAGYALNRPVIVRQLAADAAPVPSPTQGSTLGLFAAEPTHAVIEAVKRATDGDGLIVRLYEAHGSRCQAHIRAALPLARVEECDLLERPLRAGESPAYTLWHASPAASHDAPARTADGWTCALRPFEVRTFRITPAS